jgi:hypothetical protein
MSGEYFMSSRTNRVIVRLTSTVVKLLTIESPELVESSSALCLPRMAAIGPTRTRGPVPAICDPIGISGPAGGTRHRAPLEQQRNSCPYRPASREMSLMLAIPYPKRSRTGFEKAVKAGQDPPSDGRVRKVETEAVGKPVAKWRQTRTRYAARNFAWELISRRLWPDRMSALVPTRTEGSAQAISGTIGSSGPAGETTHRRCH